MNDHHLGNDLGSKGKHNLDTVENAIQAVKYVYGKNQLALVFVWKMTI